MKKLQSSAVPLLVAALFVFAGAAAIRSAAGGGEPAKPSKVVFTQDSKAAFAKAKSEGKIVMVDFNADWCGPCQKMKKEFFPDPEVAEILKGVVAVDLNVDKPGKATGLLEKYASAALPTLLFLDADGNEIGRILGYGGVEDHKAAIKKILARS